jgi:hypothetical protein
MLKVTKGALVEYSLALPPLALVFDFNPQTLSRTRTIQLRTGSAPGTVGGYDFTFPTDTPRVAQGVTVLPESLTITILIDGTDRLMAGDTASEQFGIEPELDTLRSMVEPKSQGPGGLQMLASLGLGGGRAFQREQSASVLLFVWGTHILPVFMTGIRVEETAHLPSLAPYRATVQLTMQVIEGNNPFFKVEKVRQVISAALNTGRTIGAALGGLV